MILTVTDLIYTAPLWGIALFSFLPIFIKAVYKNIEMRRAITVGIAFLGLAFSTISLMFLELKTKTMFSGLIRLDQFSWITTHILIFLSILTLPLLLSKKNHVVSDKFFSEYIFLFMNSVLGLILLVWSNNLLTAFIAIEHFSLCFYLMIPLSRDRMSSIESGLKYFVLGSVAGVLFLFGMSLVYISIGSLNFSLLFSQADILSEVSVFFQLGFGFICLALMFKVSIFPFQFWLPDVYQGSPTSLVGFMAGAVKVAVFIFLLKFVFFGGFVAEKELAIISLFQWLAILSLVIGHVSAVFQNNIKRLLIYSSIAHAGYILTTLLNPSLFSVSSLIYYILFYGVVNFGAFTFIMLFEENKTTGISLDDLSGLFKKHPAYACIFTWFLFNLAGIPPTSGFFAKLFILESLVQKGRLWVVFWVVIGSVVALYYYLKPVIVMSQDSDKEMTFEKNHWIRGSLIVQFILSIFMMVFVGDIQAWITQFLFAAQ